MPRQPRHKNLTRVRYCRVGSWHTSKLGGESLLNPLYLTPSILDLGFPNPV